jgi:hypothetical protein
MPKENGNTDQGYASGETPEATASAKSVIDRETAEAEFERYCDANEIDCDMDGMNDDEKKDFEPIKKRFIKACMQGRAKVDGMDLEYTVSKFSKPPFCGQKITVKRSGGQSYMGMDGYKDTHSIHKIHGFLSAMTRQETSFFAKIDGQDWKFFRDIATLF